MVDVGRNDRAPPGNLAADEFRGDERGNFRAKAFTVGDAFLRPLDHLRSSHILAMSDVDHFLSDDPGTSKLILRDNLAWRGPVDWQFGRARGNQLVAGDVAIVLRPDLAGRDAIEAAFGDPLAADRR